MRDDQSLPGPLSPTKRSLLSLLIKKEGIGTRAAEPITRRSDDGPQPLSFAQQRLWFLDQLEPGSPLYNLPGAVRMRGPLRTPLLELSLNEIIRRHEMLRTTFVTVETEPRQVIHAPWHLSLGVEDLTVVAEGVREAEVSRLARQEAALPFDLAAGPLVRARLLRLGEREHVALFTMHHIVSDGWSMGVLTREVASLYDSYASGAAARLPELPVQYADYAVWQRGWLRGEVLERQLGYWRTRLEGAPPLLELPTGRARPAEQTHRGERRRFALGGAELGGRLRRLGRDEGATLFMVLLAGFQLLLGREAGREDVVVGTDVAGRTRPEVEGLIGFFVNQLVLRTDVSGDPTFGELLGRVREVCLGAYQHQDVPFERVVEELRPERSLSHAPLFQVKLLLQNAPGVAMGMGGLGMEAVWAEASTAQLDLIVSVEEGGEGMWAWAEYSTGVYGRGQVGGLMRRYGWVLEEAGGEGGASLHVSRLLDAVDLRDKEYSLNEERVLEETSIHKLKRVLRRS